MVLELGIHPTLVARSVTVRDLNITAAHRALVPVAFEGVTGFGQLPVANAYSLLKRALELVEWLGWRL